MSVLLNTKIIHVLEDSCEYSLQCVSHHPPASFAMETKQTPSTIALLSSKQYVISFILCQFYKSCTYNCQTIFKILCHKFLWSTYFLQSQFQSEMAVLQCRACSVQPHCPTFQSAIYIQTCRSVLTYFICSSHVICNV